jgi:hypothetical protein
MHDLVPHDRLQRVIRVGADALREDCDVMLAGRQAHDPHRNGACARVIFRNERDADLGRHGESTPRQRVTELPATIRRTRSAAAANDAGASTVRSSSPRCRATLDALPSSMTVANTAPMPWRSDRLTFPAYRAANG